MTETGKLMAAVPMDSPVMQAWQAYKRTSDFANTRHWATQDDHVDGSLWEAFSRGFQAGQVAKPHPDGAIVLEDTMKGPGT